jgi:hypothetical protein
MVSGRIGALKKMVESTEATLAKGICALYARPTGSDQSNRRLSEPDRLAVMLTVAVPAREAHSI